MKGTQVKGRVLFVGQAYYNAWYLSRELRKIGWRADLLNFDANEKSQMYYHGQDYVFAYNTIEAKYDQINFYINSLTKYDIFHFSNAHGLYFLNIFDYKRENFDSLWTQKLFRKLVNLTFFSLRFFHPVLLPVILHRVNARRIYNILDRFVNYLPERWDIILLKKLGKKIVYSNNGCLDGVSQSSFSKWGPESVCSICRWRDTPSVCSDKKNLAWGKLRNNLADYQILLGGNRVDYNIDHRIHEVPEFYCLDSQIWKPGLSIPQEFRMINNKKIRIYHSVGNRKLRTGEKNVNIKCSHIYIPLIQRLIKEGHSVEMISPDGIPNKIIRYYQAQSDIVVDMLTFGWFGANIREAMMLGKPCVCFIRQEWFDSLRLEIPQYAEELPIINATPDSIHDVLVDLITHPIKRMEIGLKSRKFALKWHSSSKSAKRFDTIYSQLITSNKT